MEILNVKNLTMKFGSLAAVDDVSLAVRKGEIIGLIGPNGAGKTTFFNCLTGYLTPQNGAVQFDGHPITGLRPEPDLPARPGPDLSNRPGVPGNDDLGKRHRRGLLPHAEFGRGLSGDDGNPEVHGTLREEGFLGGQPDHCRP